MHRQLLILPLLLACSAATPPASQPNPDAERTAWIKRVAPHREFKPPLLTITTAEGENPDQPYSAPLIRHFYFATDGAAWNELVPPFSVQRGTAYSLKPESLKSLQQLLTQIPDPPEKLPPPNRKLLLETPDGKYRIYDRANLPDQIIKILQAANLRIPTIVPTIQPTREINSDPHALHDAASEFIDNPDSNPEDALHYICAKKGPLAVLQTKTDKILLWDREKRKSIAQLDDHATLSEASFSPDGARLATITHLQSDFSGRVDRIRLWKTTGEFQCVLSPAELPTLHDAKGLLWTNDSKYLLASTNPTIYRNPRTISIWDVATGRDRAHFDCPAKLLSLALTPDNAQLVAATTEGKLLFWNLPEVLKQIADIENSLAPTEIKGAPRR